MTDTTTTNGQRSRRSVGTPLSLPDPLIPLEEQEPVVLFAMCLFGEARAEIHQTGRAVAQVILNRARHPHKVFGSLADASLEANLRSVILKPRQFSCFLLDDPNYEKLLRPLNYESAETWSGCLSTAREALAASDEADSLTLNSDHYFDDSLQPPHWADPSKQTVRFRRLQFFRLYLQSPTAGAKFLLRTREGEGPTLRSFSAAETAAVSPSPRRESSPPETSRRVAPDLRSIIVGETSGRHRREVAGSGSFTSHPAPHLSSKRTPRLGNRWFQRSRGLSILSAEASAQEGLRPEIPSPGCAPGWTR